jgi:MFS family permease
MSFTAFLVNFGAQVFHPFISLYLLSLKADLPEIGLVYVGIALATNLVSIPGGMLADRIGRKIIIVLGNAVGFGLFLILLSVSNWTTALVVLFAATAIATLVQPAYSSTVAESVTVPNRSNAFGTFYIFVYLGLALGPVVGGYLPNPGRFEINIVVIAVLGLLTAILRLVFLRETLPRESRTTHSNLRERFFMRRISRNVWLVMIALLLYNFAAGLGLPLYAIFSTQQLLLTPGEFGLMTGAGSLAAMLGAVVVGKVSKTLGVKRMMMSAIVLSGLLLIPWLYATSVFFAIAFFAVSGFFAQFFFVGNQTLMANITTTEVRSSIIGFITTIAGIGSIIAPYLGSQLWVMINPATPFLISILLSALVALPLAAVNESPVEIA